MFKAIVEKTNGETYNFHSDNKDVLLEAASALMFSLKGYYNSINILKVDDKKSASFVRIGRFDSSGYEEFK